MAGFGRSRLHNGYHYICRRRYDLVSILCISWVTILPVLFYSIFRCTSVNSILKMSQNTSSFLVNRLYDWGVKRIYGYPGDGINGIMGALRENQDKIEF